MKSAKKTVFVIAAVIKKIKHEAAVVKWRGEKGPHDDAGLLLSAGGGTDVSDVSDRGPINAFIRNICTNARVHPLS